MKYRVELGVGQKKRLRGIVRRGKHSARKIRRARSLLHSHEGMSAPRIADLLDVHSDTVYRTRRLFVTEGLGAALEERPRSGQPRRLDGRGEATLIALACSSPPEGRAVWTMQLLADRLVEMSVVESISDETVRLTLKKGISSHGSTSSGASPR
jgi:transposase